MHCARAGQQGPARRYAPGLHGAQIDHHQPRDRAVRRLRSDPAAGRARRRRSSRRVAAPGLRAVHRPRGQRGLDPRGGRHTLGARSRNGPRPPRSLLARLIPRRAGRPRRRRAGPPRIPTNVARLEAGAPGPTRPARAPAGAEQSAPPRAAPSAMPNSRPRASRDTSTRCPPTPTSRWPARWTLQPSAHPRRIAGVARSLGRVDVSVRSSATEGRSSRSSSPGSCAGTATRSISPTRPPAFAWPGRAPSCRARPADHMPNAAADDAGFRSPRRLRARMAGFARR